MRNRKKRYEYAGGEGSGLLFAPAAYPERSHLGLPRSPAESRVSPSTLKPVVDYVAYQPVECISVLPCKHSQFNHRVIRQVKGHCSTSSHDSPYPSILFCFLIIPNLRFMVLLQPNPHILSTNAQKVLWVTMQQSQILS
jgi:hypothetical protein